MGNIRSVTLGSTVEEQPTREFYAWIIFVVYPNTMTSLNGDEWKSVVERAVLK